MTMPLVSSSKWKPKILIFTQWYTPAHKAGGPVRSIEGIVHHLHVYFDFYILACDRDIGDSRAFASVTVDAWQRVGEANVFYASSAKLSLGGLCRLLKTIDYDLCYLNGFFSPKFSILPLVLQRLGLIKRRPVVLAPRGEFSRGAIKLKYAKKQCFLCGAKFCGLHKDILWQASSRFEANDIQENFPRFRLMPQRADVLCGTRSTSEEPSRAVAESANGPGIYVAGNLRKASSFEPALRSPKLRDSLRIVFLSRISPKKNLEFALHLVNRLKRKAIFHIYGPVDDAKDAVYWAQCQRIIADMPASMEVAYKGIVESVRVEALFSQYDVFLFPTCGENYGHVIVEALAAGCPVVTSDQTPWRGLADKHAGWDIPLDQPDTFVNVLEKLWEMDNEAHALLSAGAKRLAHSVTNSDEVLQQNLDLFWAALPRKAHSQRRDATAFHETDSTGGHNYV